MKRVIIAIASIIVLTNCDGSGSPFAKTPEELRIELVSQEKTTPLAYLTVEAKMRADEKLVRAAGIFRSAEYAPDGATIHGTIKNSATIAKFKDVVLTVTFFSQTQTVIETKDYVIYEFYKPNSVNNFELKVYPPDAMKEFNVEVKGATATD